MFYVGRVFDTVQGNFPLRKLAETTSPHFPLLSSRNLKRLSRFFSAKFLISYPYFNPASFWAQKQMWMANGSLNSKVGYAWEKWPNTRVHIVKFLENRQKFGHLTAWQNSWGYCAQEGKSWICEEIIGYLGGVRLRDTKSEGGRTLHRE